MEKEIRTIIEDFERGALPEGIALSELRRITGRDIDPDRLRNYWRSESLDEFVDRLCAPPITDWQNLNDDAVLLLISEFISTNSPGRRDRIDEALARKYGKRSGSMIDLVFDKELSEPQMILGELKKDTKIYL